MWMEKGISRRNVPLEEIESKIASMKVIESKFEKLKPEYSLGYSQSESLYACQSHSTPNNVFPVFWLQKDPKRKFHRPLLIRK